MSPQLSGCCCSLILESVVLLTAVARGMGIGRFLILLVWSGDQSRVLCLHNCLVVVVL